jgi:hypothetical protein
LSETTTLLLLNSNHFATQFYLIHFAKKIKEREREREKEKKEKTFLRYNLTIATKFHIKEDRNFAGSSVV